MICLLNGHSLTAKQKFMPEKLSLQLSERTSTATMTLNADTAPSMNVGDWLRAEEGPGAGIIWRIRSMDNQVDKKTITVTMEHLINSVNFDDDESLNWFHRTLRRKGIIDELRRQGATEGSTVRIDEMEFDFVD
jgi:Obg family GTPase CgtA-like protein